MGESVQSSRRPWMPATLAALGSESQGGSDEEELESAAASATWQNDSSILPDQLCRKGGARAARPIGTTLVSCLFRHSGHEHLAFLTMLSKPE